MSSGVFVDGLQERLASASKQPEELGRIAPDGSVTLNWNVIAACAQNWKPGVLDNSGFAKLLLAARVTQPAQAAQPLGAHMNHSDVEELARKANLAQMNNAPEGVFIVDAQALSLFAALVLEKAIAASGRKS